jgi:predicted transcriptional regulator
LYKTTTQVLDLAESKRDKIQRLVLEYVRENQKCTKTEVINALKKPGDSSIKTTHSVIMELIKAGTLKVLKDRPNSQTHYLIINDDDEFNKIYKELTQIENLMNTIYESMFKLLNPSIKRGQPWAVAMYESERNFAYPYRYDFNVMLDVLLDRAMKIQPENMSNILSSKITKLMRKLFVYFYDDDRSALLFDGSITFLNQRIQELSSGKSERFKGFLDIKTMNKMIKRISEFKKTFLSKTA